MSGHVSGHGSGSDNTVYLYSSPDLPGVPPAIFGSNLMSEYSAILPSEDEFKKTDVGGEHHHQSFLEKAWMKLKHIASYIWNGPKGAHGEGEHH